MAGDEIDEAIITHIKKKHNLLIGERTAERVKIELGSAYPLSDLEDATIAVKGRSIREGIPKVIEITSEEVREAIQGPVNEILASIKEALEEVPPELSADLAERGIVLAGGGALLRGLDHLISEFTGLPVVQAEDPLTTVARGAGKVLEELDLLRKVSIS